MWDLIVLVPVHLIIAFVFTLSKFVIFKIRKRCLYFCYSARRHAHVERNHVM